jgi:hypothetical protein
MSPIIYFIVPSVPLSRHDRPGCGVPNPNPQPSLDIIDDALPVTRAKLIVAKKMVVCYSILFKSAGILRSEACREDIIPRGLMENAWMKGTRFLLSRQMKS